MVPSRLDKFMSDATSLSRSQIRKAWSAGKIEVRVEGESPAQVLALDELVFEDDEVILEGVVVERREPSVYAAFCKPAGVLSSARRQKGRRSLEPWLDQLGDGVFPIGRLDQDTSGLMLLTDDGDLSHVMTQPESASVLGYRYHIDVKLDPEGEDAAREVSALLDRVRAGVSLAENMLVAPTRVDLCEDDQHQREGVVVLVIEIDESRSKQLRSMCNVLGLDVCGLRRVAIGPVELGDMLEGDVRRLVEEEITELWRTCGGREQVTERRTSALVRLAEKFREGGEPHARLEAWLDANNILIPPREAE